MTLIGGVGYLVGPVIGAVVMDLLRVWLSEKIGAGITIVLGVIFVLCVVSFQKSIVGSLDEIRKKYFSRKSHSTRVDDETAPERPAVR